jgi:hypothetical protein
VKEDKTPGQVEVALERVAEICAEQSIRFRDAANGQAAYGASECEKAIRAMKAASASEQKGE